MGIGPHSIQQFRYENRVVSRKKCPHTLLLAALGVLPLLLAGAFMIIIVAITAMSVVLPEQGLEALHVGAPDLSDLFREVHRAGLLLAAFLDMFHM
eukprot:CAMPEP_0185272124 /NCGR_PEP_ID=MMETSP1359-20130426/46439_1 /TAXON_ID=552665 /ORGANISM="Bigelowiella longifila, Strain CCMP242" /LENGTH=95 /DNA_ID=CAMNT_0027864295 /DNA_START=334 /DNA_END=621 /DNA_ORIENTATION=-